MSAISTTVGAGRRRGARPVGAERRRGARLALLLAALCVAGMALTWVFAALVPATHVRDAMLLYDFTRLDRPIVEAPAKLLLALLEPEFFVIWGVVVVAVAVSRGRPRVGLAVVLVLTLAPLSAELLKPLVAHAHAQVVPLYITSASWPSGHATAVTALVWSAVLVAPAGRRRAVAIGGIALAAAVGCSLLILAWHMPSDVLGGYLLGTLWAALAIAALYAVGWRGPLRRDLSPAYQPTLARGHLEPIATRMPRRVGSHSRHG
jgi:membrane-associated phospholipid phosphatase